MRFDEFDEYIQERWEGMLELLEAKNKNGLVDKYNKFVYKQAHKSVTNHLRKVRSKHGTKMSPKRLKTIFNDIDKLVVNTVEKESVMKNRNVKQTDLTVRVTYTFEPFNTKKLVQQIWYKLNIAYSKGYIWENEVTEFDAQNKLIIIISIKK